MIEIRIYYDFSLGEKNCPVSKLSGWEKIVRVKQIVQVKSENNGRTEKKLC